MNDKCYGCIYYNPFRLKCSLGRSPKECTFYAMQFYGKDAVLNMVKYNPEDNTMTLTRLMVERKKNVRSYSGQ